MRTFRLADRVYLSDTDAGGIAYHKSYFNWAEHARAELFKELVPDHSQSRLADGSGVLNVVKSIDIHFRMPAHLDEDITVVSEVTKVGRFHCIISQKVMRGEDLLSDLKVKEAFIDRNTKRPVQMPQRLRAALLEEEG